MKKIGLIFIFAILCIVVIVNNMKTTENSSYKNGKSSYVKIENLDTLKNDSDIIVEVEGTDEFKKINYKGVEGRVTKLLVKDIIKGDKNLKEISIFQTEGLEEEEPPKKGERLLIFARKGIDLPEYYIVIGGTQGAFKILNETLQTYKMDNENILKELPSNYNDAKNFLLKKIQNEGGVSKINVKIIANGDSTTFEGMPIKLTPKLAGEYDKAIQYHWILENSDQYEDFEGFVAPESGPLKEIINSGEPVELGLFAEVSWVEGAVIEFKVKLQVEEKDSSNIIATDEITIENREGIYKIK